MEDVCMHEHHLPLNYAPLYSAWTSYVLQQSNCQNIDLFHPRFWSFWMRVMAMDDDAAPLFGLLLLDTLSSEHSTWLSSTPIPAIHMLNETIIQRKNHKQVVDKGLDILVYLNCAQFMLMQLGRWVDNDEFIHSLINLLTSDSALVVSHTSDILAFLASTNLFDNYWPDLLSMLKYMTQGPSVTQVAAIDFLIFLLQQSVPVVQWRSVLPFVGMLIDSADRSVRGRVASLLRVGNSSQDMMCLLQHVDEVFSCQSTIQLIPTEVVAKQWISSGNTGKILDGLGLLPSISLAGATTLMEMVCLKYSSCDQIEKKLSNFTLTLGQQTTYHIGVAIVCLLKRLSSTNECNVNTQSCSLNLCKLMVLILQGEHKLATHAEQIPFCRLLDSIDHQIMTVIYDNFSSMAQKIISILRDLVKKPNLPERVLISWAKLMSKLMDLETSLAFVENQALYHAELIYGAEFSKALAELYAAAVLAIMINDTATRDFSAQGEHIQLELTSYLSKFDRLLDHSDDEVKAIVMSCLYRLGRDYAQVLAWLPSKLNIISLFLEYDNAFLVRESLQILNLILSSSNGLMSKVAWVSSEHCVRDTLPHLLLHEDSRVQIVALQLICTIFKALDNISSEEGASGFLDIDDLKVTLQELMIDGNAEVCQGAQYTYNVLHGQQGLISVIDQRKRQHAVAFQADIQSPALSSCSTLLDVEYLEVILAKVGLLETEIKDCY